MREERDVCCICWQKEMQVLCLVVSDAVLGQGKSRRGVNWSCVLKVQV